jgi:hypothetical protein
MDTLRYPIGLYEHPPVPTEAEVRAWIAELETFPGDLRRTVARLRGPRLEEPYRPGGWNAREVVHHLADSHLNAWCRIKLALTEDRPLIKVWDEAAWARTPDYRRVPVEDELDFLELLHRKLAALLLELDEEARRRTFQHPEWGETSVEHMIGLYAWHGRHHRAQLTSLMARKGWT